MPDFKIDDIVKFVVDGCQYYGKVTKVTQKKIYVYDLYEYNNYSVAAEKAVLVEPVYLDKEKYRKLARYEITVQDIIEDKVIDVIVNKDNYIITLEDILCTLKKFVNEVKDRELFYIQWLCYFVREIMEVEYATDENEFYNDNIVLNRIKDAFVNDVFDDSDCDYETEVKNLERYLGDKNKPLTKRYYPEYAKVNLLKLFEEEGILNNADNETVELYKRFAKELCERKNHLGLKTVGYGSYGGNRAFSCDWKKAEKCMLELIETVDYMPDKAFYANTLGYIYYYGRTNNGVAQYEKAYKYFSFAAFNQIYEAQYKIADMFKNGYGVIKSFETANNIICRLYDENIKYIEDGHFDCKFADIAFRMGKYCENEEEFYESDFDNMLKYYYQADFAIRMRMKKADHYGDQTVAKSICEALDKTKKAIDFKPQSKVILYSIVSIFFDYLSKGNWLDVKAKTLSSGNIKLIFKAHRNRRDKYPKRLFITIPELDMCGFYDELTVIVKPTSEDVFCPDEAFVIDKIEHDALYFDGFPCMFYDDCVFEIRKPNKCDEKHRFVSVKFSQGGKSYDYLCDNENIKIADKVKVNVGDEEKEVTVVEVFEKTEAESFLPMKSYKRI